jgi:elongation factor P--(R)-beta-lysine ligase
VNWEPSGELHILRKRAELLDTVRRFFSQRNVLEVETPLLASSGITDPSIEPLIVEKGASVAAGSRYLQTSPEYAMKRLLAAHKQPIYQITRAFRDGEAGARHNPEFSILEWYRPGYSHHDLMDEVAELISACLGERPVARHSYRTLFLQRLEIDPMLATDDELQSLARKYVEVGDLEGDRDLWLDLIVSHVLEPELAKEGACFVYDYPASQAALSKIVTEGDVELGQRFELYVDGLELANGYCELTDPVEQRRRFEADNVRRRNQGLQERPLDENLLQALEQGLPECSGVALGLDRLLMVMTGSADIRKVLAFDWERT